jgi:hypothetical protein
MIDTFSGVATKDNFATGQTKYVRYAQSIILNVTQSSNA